MKYRTVKVKRLLIVVFMLLSVMALNLPSSSSASAVQCETQCCECQLQCANEAFGVMTQCYWVERRPLSECRAEYDQYVNNCKRLFCRYGGMCS